MQIPGPKKLISEELHEMGLLVLASGIKDISEQGVTGPNIFITTSGNILLGGCTLPTAPTNTTPHGNQTICAENPLRLLPAVMVHWVVYCCIRWNLVGWWYEFYYPCINIKYYIFYSG